ncbi:hypothetical protein H0H93_013346, partial [Arthromyces matolae]
YLLALLVDACTQHQSHKSHPDPIHVTAHYLKSSRCAEFEIRVRVIKTGRGYTNLIAELRQQGTVTISTQQIFGVNSSDVSKSAGLTLSPPSPYARRIPFHGHPSTAPIQNLPGHWSYKRHVSLAPDPKILEKNAPDHPSRTTASSIGGGGIEWGTWLTFKDNLDLITKQSVPFLVDIFAGLPFLIPPSERPGFEGESWFPTMVMVLEFKAPIPPFSSAVANRTVGVYYTGKFINDGRHDCNVEIWTAPCNLGEGQELPGWREKQACIATATMMSYMVPLEVNLERANEKRSKL